jgi:hypothetical protein
MKYLIFTLCVMFMFCKLAAQTSGWQPLPGNIQLLIWPKEAPDPQPNIGPEFVTTEKSLVAGKP